MARRSPNLIPMNWNSNNNNNTLNLNRLLLNLNRGNNNGTIRATPLYPTLYSIMINGGDELNLSATFKAPKNAEVTQGGLKIEVLKVVARAGRFQ